MTMNTRCLGLHLAVALCVSGSAHAQAAEPDANALRVLLDAETDRIRAPSEDSTSKILGAVPLASTRDVESSTDSDSRKALWAPQPIDTEVVAKVVRSRMKELERLSLEDLAWISRRFVPEVVADAAVDIVAELMTGPTADAAEQVAADAGMRMLVVGFSGLVAAATLDSSKVHPDMDGSAYGAEVASGVYWVDLAYSAARANAEVQASLTLPAEQTGVCAKTWTLPQPLTGPQTYRDPSPWWWPDKTDWTNVTEDDLKGACARSAATAKVLLATFAPGVSVSISESDWQALGSSEDTTAFLQRLAPYVEKLRMGIQDGEKRGDVLNAIFNLLRDPFIRDLLVLPSVDATRADLQIEKDDLVKRKTGFVSTLLDALITGLEADDAGQVTVDPPAFAGALSRSWYRRDGFVPYLSIGTGVQWDDATTLEEPAGLVAEKIGAVYRHRFAHPAIARTRTGTTHSMHAGLFGSGLVYNIVRNDNTVEVIQAGAVVGLSPYSVVDLNVAGGASLPVGESSGPGWFVGFSAEVPLHAYLDELVND